MQQTMMDEALSFFRDDPAYRRLFSLFKKKYKSLGRIGGTVKLTTFKDQELLTIARFFGATQLKGAISLTQFEQQLERTKFEGIGLKRLLENYFDEPLVSNKEAKQLKEQQLELNLQQLEDAHPVLSFWLNHLKHKSADTHWIYRLMNDCETTFFTYVERLSNAFQQLPDKYERLPMFSQRITRNPHAFDLGSNLGKLWIHVLTVDQQKGEGTINPPSNSEEVNELLQQYYLLRDDIMNFVTCVNLQAESNLGTHPMWEAACQTSSVLNVPLRELMALERAYPAGGGQTVWIVENSGVYSSILDQVPQVPMICTHGQFKLASLWLLDLLTEEGCTLYYAGDFDPEGLGMVERLLERYPDHAKLWKMDKPSYEHSHPEIVLTDERLKKLNSITSPSLLPIVKKMRKSKKAGYQEALVPDMITELQTKLRIWHP